AYVRRVQAERPAGEDLSESGPFEPAPRDKADDRFSGGVWFRLGQGRKHNVEPRWLLPALCNLGHLTRKDIGFIRILDHETRFEVRAEKAERFLEAASHAKGGDRGLKVARFEGDPSILPPRKPRSQDDAPSRKDKAKGGPKRVADRPDGTRPAFEKPRKPFRKKPKSGKPGATRG
ncbi:MAG: DbpA RNA binding domain-containing protein, partial [Rhizobiaceae bacterium]